MANLTNYGWRPNSYLHFFYEDFEPWLNNIMCIESKNSTPEEIAIEIEIFIKNSYSRYCLIPNRLTN